MDIYELSCRYDTRKSFYGKAKVVEDNGKYELRSYGLPIVRTDGNSLEFLNYSTTYTTLRHIREFLRQYYSYGNYTKNDIVKLMDI